MKHLKIIFRTILGLFITSVQPLSAYAQHDYSPEYYDSVEVSLLTCQPHDEIYSLYGHTAIRWHNLHHGAESEDLAFNYGVFDFKKPYFVARFVFGLTDYELGAYPFKYFLAEYRHFGSMVTEQVLNLTGAEKSRLHQALDTNLQPANRIYRYNYFYNNCTTKARDIIEQCINGKIEYAGNEGDNPSYRDMVHEMTRQHPWARFGNDVLLGVKADQPTGRRQQEFLPNNLMYDFDHAQIYDNGLYRPLVKERRIAVPGGVQMVKEGFPLPPRTCGWILAAMGTLLLWWQWKRGKAFLACDLLLMLASGAVGIVLTLMLFSQHPTVSLNLQLVFFNPLHWVFLWPVFKGRTRRYWMAVAVLFVLYIAGQALQTYAEGLWAVAYCLLLQSCIHLQMDTQAMNSKLTRKQ